MIIKKMNINQPQTILAHIFAGSLARETTPLPPSVDAEQAGNCPLDFDRPEYLRGLTFEECLAAHGKKLSSRKPSNKGVLDKVRVESRHCPRDIIPISWRMYVNNPMEEIFDIV